MGNKNLTADNAGKASDPTSVVSTENSISGDDEPGTAHFLLIASGSTLTDISKSWLEVKGNSKPRKTELCEKKTSAKQCR